jgi:TonB-dependent receptor
MDGNSVGGTVNLITKSALDNSKDVLNITVGSGYADKKPTGYYTNSLKGTYQFGLSYGTRLGEEKNIGIMVTASVLRNDRGSNNNQLTWGAVTTVAKTAIPWALQDIMLRDYSLTRDRMGLSGTLDYKPNDKNKYSLTVVYNDFDDNETRNQWRARPSKGKYNSETSISAATIEVLTRDRGQEDILNNFVGRGQNQLGNIAIDYSASYNRGSETQNFYVSPTFVINKKVDFALDLSNPDIPKYTVGGTGIPAGYELNAANYTISSSAGFRVQEGIKSTNTSYGATVNLKLPYTFAGYAADLKFGGKADMRKKNRVGTDSYYLWTGTTPLLMSQFVGATNPTISTLAGNYGFAWGQMPDFKMVRDFFDANKNGLLKPTLNHDNTEAVNNDLTEDIYAAYAMTTVNFGGLMVLAGVRDEMTSNTVNANIIQYDRSGVFLKATPATADHSYNVVLPMVNFRYAVDAQTNLRAAFTTGIGRANFVDLVPSRIIHDDANSISMGNPELQPTKSVSVDLLAEHFFQRIGIISGGFFYKSLTDIIYPSLYIQAGGTYNGYQVTQPVNAPSAKLYGFELDWQQQLTFLPGPLDGLGIYANYTYTKSSADLPDHRSAKLPGQAGNIANVALSYQKHGFTGKISVNLADKFLDVVGATTDLDTWYDAHTQWDANASYDLFSGLTVYAQFMNLSNAPLRYYMGITERPIQREYYSWWSQFGFKFNM